MNWGKAEFWLGLVLVIYLFFIGVGAAVILVVNFPGEKDGEITFSKENKNDQTFFPFGKLNSPDQGLLLLAALAGIAGSFLHTAQSLSSYVGNSSFKPSWTIWYMLRPWIGGILGLAIYFTLRAGLISGAGTMNPYGIAAFGLLGGWFSKTTTDKLHELFKTLFKTDEDSKRKDKLHNENIPVITKIEPLQVQASDIEIKLTGQNFHKGATVLLDEIIAEAEFISDTELKVLLENLKQRPPSGKPVTIAVKNPDSDECVSTEQIIVF